eukprot:scaffold2044_cov78-Skeletonema_dohrnii-CCMP3373.AAC.2
MSPAKRDDRKLSEGPGLIFICHKLNLDRECSVVVSIPLNGATPTYYGTGGPFYAPVLYLAQRNASFTHTHQKKSKRTTYNA